LTTKEATNKVTEEVIGRVKPKKVEGLLIEVETACKERRDARIAMLNDANETNRERYKVLNRKVKKAVQKHKKNLEKIQPDGRRLSTQQLFQPV